MSKFTYEIQRLQKAQNAKFNRAQELIIDFQISLEKFEESFDGEIMQDLRDDVEALVQCVHEFSAYQNAIEILKESS